MTETTTTNFVYDSKSSRSTLFLFFNSNKQLRNWQTIDRAVSRSWKGMQWEPKESSCSSNFHSTRRETKKWNRFNWCGVICCCDDYRLSSSFLTDIFVFWQAPHLLWHCWKFYFFSRKLKISCSCDIAELYDLETRALPSAWNRSPINAWMRTALANVVERVSPILRQQNLW